MIFSIIIILLIGGIAYFHYVQGCFSATLSAICAAFAAVLAVGYHETVVESLLGGRVADYAHGMVLAGLFAAIYLVLRLAFDGFVPGNVRLPLYVEKGVAAVAGVVAGVFCTGVLAIAAQLLPFGPSVAGYSRFEVGGARDVTVTGIGARAVDLRTYNELVEDTFDPAKSPVQKLLVPVDDMLLGLVARLSRPDGSLAGRRSLESVHPDYLLEAFGQRLGIEAGAKKVAVAPGRAETLTLKGIYRIGEVAQIQGELTSIRDRSVAPTVRPASDRESLLVFRVAIHPGAADKDGNFRFSLGSVRLCVDGVNWYPIGTLEDSGVLFSSRMDDFLIMPRSKEAVDLVFRVINAEVMEDPRARPLKLKAGAFLEIKRMARVDLGGQPITDSAPPRDAKVGLLWKPAVLENKPGALRIDTADAPIEVLSVQVSDELFTSINVGRGDSEMSTDFTGGKATLVSRRFKSFEVDGSISIRRLAEGEYKVRQLLVPPGRRIVQIKAARKGNPWGWSDIGKYELEDATGARHAPVGAWAVVKVGTSDHLLGRYDVERGVRDLPQIDGTPTDVYLAFAVPQGVTLTMLKFNNKPVAALTTQVK
ncbi:MAG: hypothetical protein NZ561_11485 [Phycisphaerae bacterium]|nr:hypothetical protein [Phycisphaerae bacterium]MDW8261954.1 hypothetical protein [Phycisphaerales bacterium]